MGWKADLHVHSKYSNKPTNWLLKKFGCSECFTEPEEIYNAAKKRGMTAFTITDHNQIDGCFEILKYPNTFISCEVTARFPEDNCKIHVLTYNISEKQYNEMMYLRNNVYEFTEYLNEEHICHSVAHALYSVNDKLAQEHFEKMLLMYKTFELNGCRSKYLNDSLKVILDHLTPELIDDLANKYSIEPCYEAWNKNYTAGSDDHSGIKIASKYTQVLKAYDIDDFLKKTCNEGLGIINGNDSSPNGLAYNLYSIGYQFYARKFNLDRFVSKDSSIKIIDRLLLNTAKEESLLTKVFLKIRDKKFKYDAENIKFSNSVKHIIDKAILQDHPDILEGLTVDNVSDRWFKIANSTINKGVSHFIDYLLSIAKKGNLFDIFHTLGSVGSLYFLISPYFIAYSIFSRDKSFTDEILCSMNGKKKETSIAHFTDTFYDINGVAKTLQQMQRLARKLNKRLTIITSVDTKNSDIKNIAGEVVFDPIGEYTVPEYPELKFNYPPFLEMLEYCYSNNFTHVHCATPGPVGFFGLIIANILRKPKLGTYHTAFPQYLSYMTEDSSLEDIGWKYMIWFYNQMDVVYVPSKAMEEELIEKGIDKDKILLYPRGIDTEFFRPVVSEKSEGIKLIYVGRVSKEKNLHILAEAFIKLSKKNENVSMLVVGDGPYKNEMEEQLKQYNVTFTGYKQGDELIELYSSSDLFVFPSTTDTFGNVVLEAQACGIPVIVTDFGGPQENILKEETGIVVEGNSPDALCDGMQKMIDKDKLASMGKKAREYIEGRSFEKAFLETWKIYESVEKTKTKIV